MNGRGVDAVGAERARASASRLPRGTARECDEVPVRLAGAKRYRPRFRLIETAEISLPGDWIEIDC